MYDLGLAFRIPLDYSTGAFRSLSSSDHKLRTFRAGNGPNSYWHQARVGIYQGPRHYDPN